jgi:hypothetical protein
MQFRTNGVNRIRAMRSKTNRGVWLLPLLALGVAAASFAQPPTPQQAPRPVQSWTWDQVKDRFEVDNPTLLAGKLNIDELKAEEITAPTQICHSMPTRLIRSTADRPTAPSLIF